MISHNENVKQVFSQVKTQKKTILNTLIIFLCNPIKTLNGSSIYMLNLQSFDNTLKTLFRLVMSLSSNDKEWFI